MDANLINIGDILKHDAFGECTVLERFDFPPEPYIWYYKAPYTRDPVKEGTTFRVDNGSIIFDVLPQHLSII